VVYPEDIVIHALKNWDQVSLPGELEGEPGIVAVPAKGCPVTSRIIGKEGIVTRLQSFFFLL